jgi:3-methyladenine DNA glycosylase AlkD
MSSVAVKRALAQYADPARAVASARFFKTGPGAYGEGDRFIGVSVPDQRVVARRFAQEPLPELATLLESPIHEERLTALLILVHQFKRASSVKTPDPDVQHAIVEFYIEHMDCINNWDLVDSSAPYILGRYLLTQPRSARKVIEQWARSVNQWQRRIAVLTTMAFIAQAQFSDTLTLAARLLGDKEDLIHKAVGWALREVGKKDALVLRAFLDAHHAAMPRTMLRYAIEKFSAQERRKYLARPRRET